MAYKCPKCGDPVQTNFRYVLPYSRILLLSLLRGVFSSYQCKKCGKIKRSEFPPEVRIRMNVVSMLVVVGVIIILFWLFMVASKVYPF